MINTSIESFKLLHNEINKIKNKNFFLKIIIRDALLSIGTSNAELAIIFIFATLTQKTLVY